MINERSSPNQLREVGAERPSDERLAYLAGILDGEGSIMIRKSTYRMRSEKWRDTVSPEYFPRVSVKNTNEQMIRLFKKVFGGRMWRDRKAYPSKSGFRPSKRLWCWEVSCRQAFNLVRKLLPYLIIKKPQAQKIVEFEKAKKKARTISRRKDKTGFHGKPYCKELVEEFGKFYREVKELNAGY